jgi:hypothetical protein
VLVLEYKAVVKPMNTSNRDGSYTHQNAVLTSSIKKVLVRSNCWGNGRFIPTQLS